MVCVPVYRGFVGRVIGENVFVQLFVEVRGGDILLDSLSGRSRHRGEVFEGAAQACGGVVRAVRA